jgi:hypothetical protein
MVRFFQNKLNKIMRRILFFINRTKNRMFRYSIVDLGGCSTIDDKQSWVKTRVSYGTLRALMVKCFLLLSTVNKIRSISALRTRTPEPRYIGSSL